MRTEWCHTVALAFNISCRANLFTSSPPRVHRVGLSRSSISRPSLPRPPSSFIIVIIVSVTSSAEVNNRRMPWGGGRLLLLQLLRRHRLPWRRQQTDRCWRHAGGSHCAMYYSSSLQSRCCCRHGPRMRTKTVNANCIDLISRLMLWSACAARWA